MYDNLHNCKDLFFETVLIQFVCNLCISKFKKSNHVTIIVFEFTFENHIYDKNLMQFMTVLQNLKSFIH